MVETKEIKGKEYLFVEVPEGSCDYRIAQYDGINVIFKCLDEVIRFADITKYLGFKIVTETFKWNSKQHAEIDFSPKIIGKASELTEDKWKEIVEADRSEFYIGYKNYPNRDGVFVTANESGKSLISSLSMKPETTLIIEKVE